VIEKSPSYMLLLMVPEPGVHMFIQQVSNFCSLLFCLGHGVLCSQFCKSFSRSLSLTFKKFDPCSGFLNQENGDFLSLTGDASYLQPLLGAV
jgi:hypothetical protein